MITSVRELRDTIAAMRLTGRDAATGYGHGYNDGIRSALWAVDSLTTATHIAYLRHLGPSDGLTTTYSGLSPFGCVWPWPGTFAIESPEPAVSGGVR